MADKTPEDLRADLERLTQANDDLKRANADLRRGALAAENADLKAELARVKHDVAAERGPARGTRICYQGPGESYARPATVISDGFSDRVPQPGGMQALHCHIAYGEAPHYVVSDKNGIPFHPEHTFEVDRPWNPMGAPGTWHLLDECPRQGGDGCPHGKEAATACAARAAQPPQAP